MRQELTPVHPREADLNLGEPVFTPQSIYTAEFRKIAGYHGEPSAPSVAGDQQIVTSDRQALALKARADVGCMVRCGVIERQHFEPSGEALHLISIVFWSRGFRRAVEKLGQHDR